MLPWYRTGSLKGKRISALCSYVEAYRRLCTRSPGLLDVQAWELYVLAPLVASGMPSELARRLFIACDVRGAGLMGLDDFLGALTVITAGRPDERAALLFYCIAGAAGSVVRRGPLRVLCVWGVRCRAPPATLRPRVHRSARRSWRASPPSSSGRRTAGPTSQSRAVSCSMRRSTLTLTPSARPRGRSGPFQRVSLRRRCGARPPMVHARLCTSAAIDGSWSRHPVLGWLDAVAAALRPDAELEAVSELWASGGRLAEESLLRPPSLAPSEEAGAADSSPTTSRLAGRASSLTPEQSAALLRAWQRMRLASTSGLVDADAVAAVLAPLVPGAVAAALVAAADVTGRGALAAAEWVSLAETVLTGDETAAAALLFAAADARSRDGSLDDAEVARLLEIVTLGTRVAIGTRPEPLAPRDTPPPAPTKPDMDGDVSVAEPTAASAAASPPVVVDAAMGTVAAEALRLLHASSLVQASRPPRSPLARASDSVAIPSCSCSSLRRASWPQAPSTSSHPSRPREEEEASWSPRDPQRVPRMMPRLLRSGRLRECL